MISARELFIIIIGLALTFVLSALIGNINLNNQDILLIAFFLVIGIVVVIYQRTGEVNKEVDILKEQNKKLDEKLKIYEHLINIKADIEKLKNG